MSLLIAVIGSIAVAIDLIRPLIGFRSAMGWTPYYLLGGAAVWLALRGLAERIRRRTPDRALDVIDFLFPECDVFEVKGTHFLAFGWISVEKEPSVRIMVLAQNCHEGRRRLRLEFQPREHFWFMSDPSVSFDFDLGPEGVQAGFAVRRLTDPHPSVGFDFKARAAVEQGGRRALLRRGWAPLPQWSEAGKAIAAVHSPLHAAALIARPRGSYGGAPIVMHRQSEFDGFPWPEDGTVPVWSPEREWELEGPADSFFRIHCPPYRHHRAG